MDIRSIYLTSLPIKLRDEEKRDKRENTKELKTYKYCSSLSSSFLFNLFANNAKRQMRKEIKE